MDLLARQSARGTEFQRPLMEVQPWKSPWLFKSHYEMKEKDFESDMQAGENIDKCHFFWEVQKTGKKPISALPSSHPTSFRNSTD
jgi:hypothetical protein